MPRLKHFDDWGTVRFVTFSCYRRYSLLTDERVIETLLNHLNLIRNKHSLNLFGYVVMPEHVHLVIYPPEPIPLGRIIGELKSRSAREIASILQSVDDLRQVLPGPTKDNRANHTIWMARCYDHNCRNQDTVIEKINYCHYNPVKRGLVTDPGQWKWSSHNWYRGQAGVPLGIDEIVWNPTASGGAPASGIDGIVGNPTASGGAPASGIDGIVRNPTASGGAPF